MRRAAPLRDALVCGFISVAENVIFKMLSRGQRRYSLGTAPNLVMALALLSSAMYIYTFSDIFGVNGILGNSNALISRQPATIRAAACIYLREDLYSSNASQSYNRPP